MSSLFAQQSITLRMLAVALAACGFFGISSCTSRPGAEVLAPVAHVQSSGRMLTVLAATNRQSDSRSGGYTGSPAPAMTFERYTMSIPSGHQQSSIEYPQKKPDARKAIVVTQRQELPAADFARLVASMVSPDGTVGIFVPGYNYSFQEGLYRLTQIAADADIGATPILFSWPSQASLAGYIADRDATLYSRDELGHLLEAITAQPRIKHVVVFGHSMGGFLTMEVLRDLRLQKRNAVISKLSVVLAAPDIDADVFSAQLDVIGKLTPSLTVLVSKDDKALAASSFVSGDRERIGRLDVSDPVVSSTAKRYGVRIVDISTLQGSDGLGHDRYTSLAKYGAQLASIENGKTPSALSAGAFVFDAAGALVSSPFRLASSVIQPQ